MKIRGFLVTCVALSMVVTVGAITNKTISATMKQQTIVTQGKKVSEDVIVYQDTTYVPLRELGKLMNVAVDYKDQTIYLGSPQNNTSQGQNGKYISGNEAKAIALKHAGVSEKDARITQIKLDRDDQRMVYDVEFYVGNKEYDYEIDAVTGKILSYDYDIEGFNIPQNNKPNNNNNNQNNNAQNNYIGKEKAERIALNHASLAPSQVKRLRSELDNDDGRWVYQVEFDYGTNEYEYDIDAYTGKIISYSIDNN